MNILGLQQVRRFRRIDAPCLDCTANGACHITLSVGRKARGRVRPLQAPALRESLMMLRSGRHFSNAILRQSFDRRSIVVGGLQAGIGVLLAARMGWIAIFQNEKYKLDSESNRVNLTLSPPRRGWILDRNGAPLASNRTDFRVDMTSPTHRRQVALYRLALHAATGRPAHGWIFYL